MSTCKLSDWTSPTPSTMRAHLGSGTRDQAGQGSGNGLHQAANRMAPAAGGFRGAEAAGLCAVNHLDRNGVAARALAQSIYSRSRDCEATAGAVVPRVVRALVPGSESCWSLTK